MNLQITSDSVNNVGGTNFTNNFVMSLKEPIDCENTDRYITVLSVSYPLTTKNVVEKKCKFSMKIEIKNFKAGTTGDLTFRMGPIFLPDGIFDIEMIIDYMNSYLEEFGIILKQNSYGMISIYYDLPTEYWFLTKKSTKGFERGDTLNGRSVRENVVTLTLSDKLRFMLGFKTNTIVEKSAKRLRVVDAPYLPDQSDGINKMYIYCDEVEMSILGDSKSSILTTVPIQLKGQGSAELVTYAPPTVKRKLIKSHVDKFNISVRDSSSNLIKFDSGTISIECLIE